MTEQENLLRVEALQNAAKAAAIEEALTILRSLARTQDYLVGFSLAEAVQERISAIGFATDENVFIGNSASAGSFGRWTYTGNGMTLLSRLLYVKNMLLGTDGKSGIIGAEIAKAEATE